MDKAARRAALLLCAVEACSERGLSRVSHADVAAKADVSVPTVFFYFRTRELLVDEILTEVERFHMSLTQPSEHKRTAEEELVEMVLACAEGVRSHPAYMRVWLDWSTAMGSAYWPRYRVFVNHAIRIFKKVLRDGQRKKDIAASLDADDAARIIVGEAHMVAMMMFSGYSLERVRGFVRHLVSGAVRFPST
jgi:TetR/AcrR family hemagglutinin/protease transcriptional regulator